MEKAFGHVFFFFSFFLMLFPQSPSMIGLMVADPLVSRMIIRSEVVEFMGFGCGTSYGEKFTHLRLQNSQFTNSSLKM